MKIKKPTYLCEYLSAHISVPVSYCPNHGFFIIYMVSQNPLLDYLRERRGGDHLVRLGDAHQTAALTLAKPFCILSKKILLIHLYFLSIYVLYTCEFSFCSNGKFKACSDKYFTYFTWNRLLWAFFIFSIPVAATVGFLVSRVGPIAPLLFLVDHVRSIRDTIESTVDF